MSSSTKAAIHLGPNYLENLQVYKNTNFEEMQSLLNISQTLILEQSEEILNVNTVENASPSWTRSTLSHEQVMQWTKAKVRVCSDSVLCLVKKWAQRGAITRWEGQGEEFKMYTSYGESLGIDGEAIEFEWNIFRALTSLQILQKIQNDFQERNIEPEKFNDRIMFMSMFNAIHTRRNSRKETGRSAVLEMKKVVWKSKVPF